MHYIVTRVPAVTPSTAGHPREVLSGEGQMCISKGEVRFTLLSLTDIDWCCIPGKYMPPFCCTVTSGQKFLQC